MYTTGGEILESGKISPAIVFPVFHYDFTIQASTMKTIDHTNASGKQAHNLLNNLRLCFSAQNHSGTVHVIVH